MNTTGAGVKRGVVNCTDGVGGAGAASLKFPDGDKI